MPTGKKYMPSQSLDDSLLGLVFLSYYIMIFMTLPIIHWTCFTISYQS